MNTFIMNRVREPESILWFDLMHVRFTLSKESCQDLEYSSGVSKNSLSTENVDTCVSQTFLKRATIT